MRTIVAFISMVVLLGLVSCSGGENILPVIEQTKEIARVEQTLWGYYDVLVNVAGDNIEVEIVPNRTVATTFNVVEIMNNSNVALNFVVNSAMPGIDYIDVDIDVSLTHPMTNAPQYNGYDVRGVFMGDGAASMQYNSALIYPVLGPEQFMLADPFDGLGGPDGYTRWFNNPEFLIPGILGYTKGKLAVNDNCTATLNPYKYFADGLGVNTDLWDWLNTNSDGRGVFSSGQTNARNYYLRFPDSKGVAYGYAVLANWEGVEPQLHPANTVETVVIDVSDTSNTWYTSPTENGGNIILDISVFGWEYQPSIFIESTVLSVPYELASVEMTPVGGGEHYSTYHVEIPADNISGTEGQEYWVIAQYNDFDYANEFGVPNSAGTDPLASFFRFGLAIASVQPPFIEIVSPNGGEQWGIGSNQEISWMSNASTPVKIEYSKDDFIADINVIASGEPNDESFDWSVPIDISDTVKVRISLTSDPNLNDVSDAVFSILDIGWARTWGSTLYDSGLNVAVDSNGNVYTVGYFRGLVDFDPGPNNENHFADGYSDIFLSKFDAAGNFLWAKTWGGIFDIQEWEELAYGVDIDQNDNVCVTGKFVGVVDFDPGSGVDQRTAPAAIDMFVSKFDPDGNFVWVQTLNYPYGAEGRDLSIEQGNVYVVGFYRNYGMFTAKLDTDGNFLWVQIWYYGTFSPSVSGYGIVANDVGVYITGSFQGAVDFDPGPGIDNHISNLGNIDIFLSKLDTNGDFQWARTWGWILGDEGRSVSIDVSGNSFCTGRFSGTVDFDPGPGTDNKNAGNGSALYLTKYNAQGDYIWTVVYGTGLAAAVGYGIALDDSDNIFVAGLYSQTINTVPYNAFVGKWDDGGNLLWARDWGQSAAIDFAFGVDVHPNGNSYVTGFFQGTVDFDPGSGADNHVSNGDRDIFVTKFLPDGYW